MLRGSCAVCRQEDIAINADGAPHGLHDYSFRHREALRERRREEKRRREAARVAHESMGVPPPFPPEHCRGERCAFHERHDVTGEPIGAACGKAATQVIFWKNGRFSPGCGQHGLKSLAADAVPLVLCVHPIDPAIVAEAHEVVP
jgi:hypothetical protein